MGEDRWKVCSFWWGFWNLKKTLENMKKKIEKAMKQLKEGLNNQLKEVENFTPKQFLESKYGKPLKEALVKQLLSKATM